ncbi:MAG: hypothetical protein H0T11_03455 [Chthoniobacterales bacterium]|nr:hypothetical protein [Chthoniobacterales bacterium]
MLVWFNPEEPEYIALTSLDRKRGPFVVAREEQLPAIGASTDQIRRSNAQIDAHNEYAKTAYRLIAPQLAAHSFRRLGGVDARTVEIGEQLRAQVDGVKAQRRRARATVHKVHDLSRELNLRPSPQLNADTAERMAEGLDLMAEARQLRRKQKEQTT